jgi:hypothetical protein
MNNFADFFTISGQNGPRQTCDMARPGLYSPTWPKSDPAQHNPPNLAPFERTKSPVSAGWARHRQRSRAGSGVGQGWARAGPGLGQGWARAGSGMGQGWARAGLGLGQGWARKSVASFY